MAVKTIKCSYCNSEWEQEICANSISFCPNCYKYDHIECEYGYGPVTPCTVYLGSEKVGVITCGKNNIYRYNSDKYDIHINLKNSYLDALHEVRNLMEKLWEGKSNYGNDRRNRQANA